MFVDSCFENWVESKTFKTFKEGFNFLVTSSTDIGYKRFAVGLKIISKGEQRFEHTRGSPRCWYKFQDSVALFALLVDCSIFGSFFFTKRDNTIAYHSGFIELNRRYSLLELGYLGIEHCFTNAFSNE